MMYWMMIGLLTILASLGAALIFMLRSPSTPPTPTETKQPSKRMIWALTLRIVISIGLFVSLWIAYAMGWIAPHGIPLVGR